MYMDDQFPKENFDAGASNAGYGANQVVQINHAGGAYVGGGTGFTLSAWVYRTVSGNAWDRLIDFGSAADCAGWRDAERRGLRVSPRTLLGLGKARANGQTPEAAISQAGFFLHFQDLLDGFDAELAQGFFRLLLDAEVEQVVVELRPDEEFGREIGDIFLRVGPHCFHRR